MSAGPQPYWWPTQVLVDKVKIAQAHRPLLIGGDEEFKTQFLGGVHEPVHAQLVSSSGTSILLTAV